MSEGKANALFDERERSLPAQFPNKESKFKDYVLPRTKFLPFGSCSRTGDVVGSENDYRTMHVRRVGLEFLDECFAFVGLLVQDDWFKVQFPKKSRHRFLDTVIMAMHCKKFCECLARPYMTTRWCLGFPVGRFSADHLLSTLRTPALPGLDRS